MYRNVGNYKPEVASSGIWVKIATTKLASKVDVLEITGQSIDMSPDVSVPDTTLV